MNAPRSWKQRLPAAAAVVAAVAAMIAMVAISATGQDPGEPPPANNVLVCIDSTKSTDDVRDQYRVDLEEVVAETAENQDRIAVAACGNNATGKVNWPVRQRFERTQSSELLRNSQIEQQEREVIEGPEGEDEDGVGIVDLLRVKSEETTPIGEMLAVMARQCAHWGGNCDLYVFTDGEWADNLLRVKGGISAEERRRYMDAYVQQLSGLEGSDVHFVGVGLETDIRETRLEEAREAAEELIEAAGGTVKDWTARL